MKNTTAALYTNYPKLTWRIAKMKYWIKHGILLKEEKIKYYKNYN